MSMINTTTKGLKQEKSLFFLYFSCYELLKFHAQIIISGPGQNPDDKFSCDLLPHNFSHTRSGFPLFLPMSM